jgi:hypothetical protein
MGNVYNMTLSLKNLEIFRCDYHDLIKLKFKLVPKRSILMPLTFFWSLKRELAVDPNNEFRVYSIGKSEFNFNKTLIKFSYCDIVLINGVIAYQKENMKKVKREPSERLTDE